jgi:hypothetical protein
MPVPKSELGDDADWGDDGYESEPATSLPKRSKSKKTNGRKSKSKSNASSPGVVKRIFAVLGMILGVCIVLFGAYGMINGHMRAGRAIGGGLVMASVSFGWFHGISE